MVEETVLNDGWRRAKLWFGRSFALVQFMINRLAYGSLGEKNPILLFCTLGNLSVPGCRSLWQVDSTMQSFRLCFRHRRGGHLGSAFSATWEGKSEGRQGTAWQTQPQRLRHSASSLSIGATDNDTDNFYCAEGRGMPSIRPPHRPLLNITPAISQPAIASPFQQPISRRPSSLEPASPWNAESEDPFWPTTLEVSSCHSCAS
jgi:hypothetical protein